MSAFERGVASTTMSPATETPRLLGSYVVPHDLRLDDTPVGGLSGIDRDRRTGQYLMISDDQSQQSPSRFYTAQIDVDERGIHDVRFTEVHFFRRPDGEYYPSRTAWAGEQADFPQIKRNLFGTVDPEDIRVHPGSGNVFWAQEGLDLTTADGEPMLIEPAIRVSAPDGAHLYDLPTPQAEIISAGSGPRHNRALEGITFAGDGEMVVSVMEGALRQDGPESSRSHGSLSRITVQNTKGAMLAQYAYPLDPLPDVTPRGTYGSLIGISSILAFEPGTSTRFLIMERSFVSGYGRQIRVYDLDCSEATNIADVPSLVDARIQPARKRLLADLGELGLSEPANFEGMTWGPDLSTGERVLLFISDNDFREVSRTQLVALAVPRDPG